MGDISKLPKWAQSHIRSLERRIEDQANRIQELEDLWDRHMGHGLTDTWFEFPHDTQRPLPIGTRVFFHPGVEAAPTNLRTVDDDVIRVKAYGGSKEYGLSPYVEVMAMHQIEIIPWSSNVIRVRSVRP